MTEILYRLDRNLDGSGDLHVEIPADMDAAALEELSLSIAEDVKAGQDLFLMHLDPDQVREYRQAAKGDRIPDPSQDN